MATVVVCDDDTVVRTAVSAVCATAGLEVVAETDNSNDAVEMVRRFGVDVLVLDLSLADGSGEQTLTALAAEGSHTAVIVFTAYASDPNRLLALGAREVVEKPEFEQLGAVLAGLATSVDDTENTENRRLASREVEAPPKLWRSPSGVSSRQDLAYSLLQMEPGDATLAVTVVGLDSLEADVGPLLVADCRLAVAALLQGELRVQDLLHEAPEVGGFIALLRGGDARAAGAVWSRLTSAVRDAGLPGEVKGAASRVDGIGAKDAVSRAIGALQPAAVGSSPFLSV
jgi:CheY-like chemotaxis protein